MVSRAVYGEKPQVQKPQLTLLFLIPGPNPAAAQLAEEKLGLAIFAFWHAPGVLPLEALRVQGRAAVLRLGSGKKKPAAAKLRGCFQRRHGHLHIVVLNAPVAPSGAADSRPGQMHKSLRLFRKGFRFFDAVAERIQLHLLQALQFFAQGAPQKAGGASYDHPHVCLPFYRSGSIL